MAIAKILNLDLTIFLFDNIIKSAVPDAVSDSQSKINDFKEGVFCFKLWMAH